MKPDLVFGIIPGHNAHLDEAFLNLGLVLRTQGRFEEAAECFREAIHLDPGYRAARRALRDVERCLKLGEHRF